MGIFGGIAVEFVPEGMTPEEARKQRTQKQNFGTDRREMAKAIGSVFVFLLLCVFAFWYYVPRGQAEEAPVVPVVAESTALPGPVRKEAKPVRLAPDRRPLEVVSPIPQQTRMPRMATIFLSPLTTPTAAAVSVLALDPTATATATPALPTATATLTPTATPDPFDYVVFGNEYQYSDMYTYISGWIVESDGVTPRPAKVRLRFNGGEMLYPRPNNRDVANGHYEFMATPGRYWLEIVGDGPSQVVEIDIGDSPVRREISFRFNKSRPITPARSVPWDEPKNRRSISIQQQPTPTATPTATATATPINYRFRVYMPMVAKNHPKNMIYLPLIRK